MAQRTRLRIAPLALGLLTYSLVGTGVAYGQGAIFLGGDDPPARTAPRPAKPPAAIPKPPPPPTCSPSREETLSAITQIYEGQNDCTRDNDGVSRWKGDFEFSSYEDKVRFVSYFQSRHSQSGQHDGPKTISTLVFNPADVNIGLSTYSHDDESFYLSIHCKGGRECMQYSRTRFITFCDSAKRDRVYRAIKHLQKFYRPTKGLPF